MSGRKTSDLIQRVTAAAKGAAAPASRPTPTPAAPRETGFVGKALAESNRSLDDRLRTMEAENATLRGELASKVAAIQVDPARVRLSKYADRHPRAFEGPAFDAFVEDIKGTNGNEMPGFVRPVRDDPNFDYELASGHRRHAACLRAALPFRVIVEDMDDKRLVAHMRVENRGRADLSDFELGTQLARLLREGVYSSERELARGLGEARSTIQRLLKFGELPRSIIEVFPDPREIRVLWLPTLLVVGEDTDIDDELAALRSNASLTAAERFERLRAVSGLRRKRAESAPPFARRIVNKRPAIVLREDAPETLLTELEAVVKRFYDAAE